MKQKISKNVWILGAVLIVALLVANQMGLLMLVTEQQVPLSASPQYPSSTSWTQQTTTFTRDTGANIIPSQATVAPGTYSLRIQFGLIRYVTVKDCNGGNAVNINWNGGAENLQFTIPSACIGANMPVKFFANTPGTSNFYINSAYIEGLQYDDGTPAGCTAAECAALDGWSTWYNKGCVNGQMKQEKYFRTHTCENPICISHDTQTETQYVANPSCTTTTPTPCTSTCSTLGATRCVSGSPTKIEICQTSGTCKVWNAVTCEGGTTCQPTNPPNCGTGTPTTSPPPPPPPGTETCSDGVLNQGELKTDCGGPCPACSNEETCTDGVQNQGEFGTDCGGPCEACPPPEETCTDNLQNQGETGVDCGGPCDACAACTAASDCDAKSITCIDGSLWSYTPACSSGTCAYTGEPPATCTGVKTCTNPWENPQNNCQPNWLWITLGAVVVILLIALVFKSIGRKPPVQGFMPY